MMSMYQVKLGKDINPRGPDIDEKAYYVTKTNEAGYVSGSFARPEDAEAERVLLESGAQPTKPPPTPKATQPLTANKIPSKLKDFQRAKGEIGSIRSKSTQTTSAKGTEATPAEDTEATPAEDTEATPAEGTEATPAEGTEATPAEGTEATPTNAPRSTRKNK
jgi:hypothetical protein